MRIAVALGLLLVVSSPSLAPAAIDKLQKEDGPRFVIGMLNLYYNIGKGLLGYGTDVVTALPDLPKAVATDVFQVGQKSAPGYYLTEEEKQQIKQQKRTEQQLRAQEKKDKLLQQGVGPMDKLPITSIRPD